MRTVTWWVAIAAGAASLGFVRGETVDEPAAGAAPAEQHALVAFARPAAPVGGEAALLDRIEARLQVGLHTSRDALGSLHVRSAAAGADWSSAGPASAVVLVGVDEPCHVVSHVEADGWLRLRTLGAPTSGEFSRSHEGRPVSVLTRRGEVPGVIVIDSVHLRGARPATVGEEHLWLDVGADSPDEVAALGIELLDAVVQRELTEFHGGRLAGPAIGRRAAALALLEALAELGRVGKLPDATAVVFVAQSTVGSGNLGRGGEVALRRYRPERVLWLRARGGLEDAVASWVPGLAPGQEAGGADWSGLDLRVENAGSLVETVQYDDVAFLTAELDLQLRLIGGAL